MLLVAPCLGLLSLPSSLGCGRLGNPRVVLRIRRRQGGDRMRIFVGPGRIDGLSLCLLCLWFAVLSTFAEGLLRKKLIGCRW